jgi:hypothetical protein
MFGSLGDTTQSAVQKYLNSKKVPQIFIFAGGARWNDPEHFPWTMQWPPTFKTEALLYAKYIQQSDPNARIGIISSTFMKDVQDPQWASDPGMKKYLRFMSKYMPGANAADILNVSGYLAAQALVHALQECGDDLSRENVMKQATSISNLELDMLLPGIRLNNTANNYTSIRQLRMMRFSGTSWELFSEVLAE